MNSVERLSDTKKRMGDIFIPHPRVKQAFQRLDIMCSDSANDAVREKPCVLLEAPSQSGKTETLRQYAARLNTPGIIDQGSVPVLLVTLDANITRKMLLQNILTAIERFGFWVDPKAGTESVLQARVVKTLRNLDVQLLVLDEIQHLKHGRSERYAYDVGEMIKRILLDGACSVVMSGVGAAAHEPFGNEQLAYRAYPTIDFSPLAVDCEADRATFCDFTLRYLAELNRLQIVQNAAAIAQNDNIACLHEASEGVLGRVCRIFESAVEQMILRNDNGLAVEDLAEAVQTRILQHRTGRDLRNPFRDGFAPLKRR